MFWKKKKIVVTHRGSFHSDDVFAAATLHLYFQKIKQPYKLVRTVDTNIIQTADFVFDISGIYDPETNRFDHHQKGGAGERENGIPYAAFGLVWKKYGALVAGGEDTAQTIDRTLVQAIDAGDNGVDLFTTTQKDVNPVLVQSLIQSFNTSFDEEGVSSDERFDQAMSIAMLYLKRVIHQTKAQETINQEVARLYQEQGSGKMVIVDKAYGRVPILIAVSLIPDIVYFVYPANRDGGWNVCASRVSADSFESKKPFPESWRGLRDEDLEKASGISGATFCHNSGFLCATKNQESAVALAQKALEV